MTKLNIRTNSPNESQLKHQLTVKIFIIIILVISLTMSITVFGPTLGGIFAFISIHRNDKDTLTKPLPNTPIFSNIPSATNVQTITINGYADPGNTIKLYVNGPEAASVVTNSDGLFTFLNVPLINGNNTIFGKAIDSDGRESEPNQSVSIRYDTDKPKIEIISPKDGETVKNLDNRVLVQGKVDKKAEVKVNDRLAIFNNDNSFSVLLGADPGKMKITVEAMDEAGNTNESSISITYQNSSF